MLWHPVTQKTDIIQIDFVNKVTIDIQQAAWAQEVPTLLTYQVNNTENKMSQETEDVELNLKRE